MTVYVYTEYCDTCPYETEIIEVYESEQDARIRLKNRVQAHFRKSWEDIVGDGSGYDEETSDTLVTRWEGDDKLYWTVNECTVVPTLGDYTRKQM